MKTRIHVACRVIVGLAAIAHSITPSSAAVITLLTDNFNESPANESAATFNNYLNQTQGGALATVNYTVGSGSEHAAQHSNGGAKLLVATFAAPDGRGFGRVSLDNNFAIQANSYNQPVQFSFNIVSVSGYATETDRWVSFSVGSAQNQFITQDAIGVLFRANGATQTLNGGTGLGGTPNWTANDLVTITLSGTGGVGSAFNGNGSEATISIGSNNIGTFAIAQQTNAYATFSAYNNTSMFGVGEFDNLTVSVIPEPAGIGLLGLGACALLWRRRK